MTFDDIVNKDTQEMSIEELILFSKELMGLMLSGVYDEVCKQYDNHDINVNPFDQIRNVLDEFEKEYLESMKPKLELVKDEEDTVQEEE